MLLMKGRITQPKMLRNDEYIRFSVDSLKPGMSFVRIRSNHYGTAPFVV